MKQVFKNTAILLAITLVAVVALAFVYEVTKEPIALAEQQAKAEAYRQVFAEASSFDTFEGSDAALEVYNNALDNGAALEEILAAKDASGAVLGYVLTTKSSKGYGGDVRLALGIDRSATVIGYAVLSHSESPGFGANCENADVREQFLGIHSADEIEGISGATYTTNALKTQTQAAIDLVKDLEAEVAG